MNRYKIGECFYELALTEESKKINNSQIEFAEKIIKENVFYGEALYILECYENLFEEKYVPLVFKRIEQEDYIFIPVQTEELRLKDFVGREFFSLNGAYQAIFGINLVTVRNKHKEEFITSRYVGEDNIDDVLEWLLLFDVKVN